jgi:hypothetical protein
MPPAEEDREFERASLPRMLPRPPSRRACAWPATIWVAAVVPMTDAPTVPAIEPLTLLFTAGFASAAQLLLTAIKANASLIRRMHHSSSMTHTQTGTFADRVCVAPPSPRLANKRSRDSTVSPHRRLLIACHKQSKFYSNVIFAVAERRNITTRTEMHQTKPEKVN